MNSLGLYIKEALEDKKEIYLLGIGTFKKERNPAYFDELTKKFVPPTQIIQLDSKTQSSFSMIEFLTNKENISKDEAETKLKKALATLYEQQKVSLEGIGELRKQDDAYELTSIPTKTDGLDAYEPVAEIETLEPIKSGTREKVEVPSDSTSVVLIPETTLPETELAEQQQQLVEQPKEVFSARWLWPTIGIATCILLLGVWLIQPNIKAKNPANLEVTDTSEKTNYDIEIDTVETSLNEIALQDSLALDTTKDAPIAEEITSTMIRVPQGRFEIIIAAFKTLKEAEEYVTQINSKGYDVYILKNNRATSLNKVSYSSFQTEEEASIALAKVRKELNAEAWLWENNRTNINNKTKE